MADCAHSALRSTAIAAELLTASIILIVISHSFRTNSRMGLGGVCKITIAGVHELTKYGVRNLSMTRSRGELMSTGLKLSMKG